MPDSQELSSTNQPNGQESSADRSPQPDGEAKTTSEHVAELLKALHPDGYKRKPVNPLARDYKADDTRKYIEGREPDGNR
jgi:hypothetical protein